MLIGIISDTHDNMPMLRKAVTFLNERKVAHVIHAGDFTSPFTFRALKDLACDFTGIYGNNDGERVLLQKLSKQRIFTQPYILDLAGRKIVIMHEHQVVDALADSGHYDLVIYGHTHKQDIRREGKTLVINPGESTDWLTGQGHVVILDLETMEYQIIPL